MPAPPVDELPEPPLRSMTSSVFIAAAETWVAAQPTFRDQLVALAAYLEGLESGTLDPQLLAIAGLTPSADQVAYFTSSTAAALMTVTSFARSLLDDTTAASMRTTLGLGTSATMAAEWAPNVTAAGDVYIPAVEAMTIDQGNAAIGTGTITFAKSTTASPGTFSGTSLPATLQAGAWLKVSFASVTGFCATHLKRTA